MSHSPNTPKRDLPMAVKLASEVNQVAPLIAQASILHQRGEFNEAKAFYEKVLGIQPNHFDALRLLGVLLVQTKQFARAVDFLTKVLQINPSHAASYSNRGIALQQLKRLHEALESYDKAIGIKPDYAEAYYNRGIALQELKRSHEALESYDRAISIKPNYAEAYSNRGIALKELNRLDEALESYVKAIRIKPDYAQAYINRGITLQELKQLDEALQSYDRAISIKPNDAETYSNRGIALQELKQLDEAIESYDRAITIKPDYAEAYSNRSIALKELNRLDEAIANYYQALQLKPDCDFLLGTLQHTKMHVCDWKDFDNQENIIIKKINALQKTAKPFQILALKDCPKVHQLCAQIYSQDKYPVNYKLLNNPKHLRRDKIRVGYFSADFRNHAVSFLTAELFETHNKNEFEIIAFSLGSDKPDEMRSRLSNSFSQFIDVRNQSDQAVARLAREMGIDVAVDLGGYTIESRTGIFAYRAAPIQLSYIGYLGTMGVEYFDYLIADSTIIPTSSQQFYSEKIIYLPSYQVNDSKRVIADKKYTRQELGLPDIGFVFCCFNQNYKILPNTFDSWMRILKAVRDSVLFLYSGNHWAEANLKKEAQARGVDSERLVFGKLIAREAYLARYQACDLFLDTLPYNAGTTASDALWAGLPVLTLMGESFASRVASSLLNAIDLPELITTSQAEYEALAIEIATNPQQLIAIKQKLFDNRLTTPLFDTPLFTKNLEAAYKQIMERYWGNLPPDHIYIKS